MSLMSIRVNLYSIVFLNFKEILAWSRLYIWSLVLHYLRFIGNNVLNETFKDCMIVPEHSFSNHKQVSPINVKITYFYKVVLLSRAPTSTQLYPPPPSSFQLSVRSTRLQLTHFSLHPAFCSILNVIRTKILHVIGQCLQM